MKLYKIDFDGESDYVEAESFTAAITIWRDYNVRVNDMDADAEPDSVTLMHDGPALRGKA